MDVRNREQNGRCECVNKLRDATEAKKTKRKKRNKNSVVGRVQLDGPQ